ncbi:MAG: hypothetical protein E4H36_07965 [Spirochaetales bacterium]|nr:MAG: hypothetical protein E4H36_07965 [Spirochaetales bacterium]
MKREEFLFTIGYEGGTALVDGNSMRQYKKATAMELAQKGLYKPALCAALFDGNTGDVPQILQMYNENSGSTYATIEDLKRLFGVYEVPQNINKVMII